MAISVQPFLMFQDGQCEPALNFYRSVFPEAEVAELTRHGPEAGAAAGQVLRARLVVGYQPVICFDSPVAHAFGFTPSFSFFVDFDDRAEQDRAYAALSEGGQVMMGMADYGFSKRFAWVSDRFGVSWQLNLP